MNYIVMFLAIVTLYIELSCKTTPTRTQNSVAMGDDEIGTQLSPKNLYAEGRSWEECITSVMSKAKAVLFSENFSLAESFEYRWGLDGYKYWVRVTNNKNSNEFYVIAFRAWWDDEHRTCGVALNTVNPFYVTDAEGTEIAAIEGAYANIVFEGIEYATIQILCAGFAVVFEISKSFEHRPGPPGALLK